MIKLSIIIPVFNVEKYVQKCLESVFSQDLSSEEYEVIVIDDGTPDNSMEIVENFANKYSNLKVIRQSNQGLSVARNAGLNIASGEYIWFIDSDDRIEVNCLKSIVDLINTNPVDLIVSPFYAVDESTESKKIRNLSSNLSSKQMTGLDYLSSNSIRVPMQIFFIKRSFLVKYGLKFYPEIYHEDLEFAPRMLFYAKTMYASDKAYYLYLLRSSGSITSSINMKRIKDLFKIHLLLGEFSKLNVNDSNDKKIFKTIIIKSAFSVISNLGHIRDSSEKDKFLKSKISYFRKIGVMALFIREWRYFLFGIMMLLHPKVFMAYSKVY